MRVVFDEVSNGRAKFFERKEDLIEYALVVALIAFAAIAGMGTVATNINQAFSKIGSKLVSSIT